MDESTKVLLLGGMCAALVVVGGIANTYRLESKVQVLEAACKEPTSKETTSKETTSLRFVPFCESKELLELGELKGIQAEIVAAQRDVWGSKKWPYVIAAGLFILSAFPWLWYFLLRRIRELRDATIGPRSYMSDSATVTKVEYLHEAQCALAGCQLVEQGLKSYICTAYKGIHQSGGDTALIKHTDAEIEELPLGPLISLFEPLVSNPALVSKLKDLRPKRNDCAHKAFVLAFFADVRSSIDLRVELQKVSETRISAMDTMQMLTPELLSIDARINVPR